MLPYKTILLSFAMSAVASIAMADVDATVRIANTSGGKIYFQPESMQGYSEVTSADTTISVHDSPVYYRLVGVDGTFYPVYISPGSVTDIAVTPEGVTISGTNERENGFMREHSYICRSPKEIKKYSPEWTAWQEGEISRLDSLLEVSGHDQEFVATQRLYHRYTLNNRRLGGVALAKVFAPGGQKVEVGEDFYAFLDTLKFDDKRLLRIPKWFDVMDKAFGVMENRGIIPVSNDSYMSIYAKAIEDETVRSHFLTSLLAMTLKRNYLNDFASQYPVVRPLITAPDAVAKLPALEKEYASRLETAVACGTPMPEFVARTVDGKEYNIKDFRGEYVLIDFWFTGCVPCRAEMPYFDELAGKFDGRGVKFISLSVDAGPELYAEWERMMREKPHAPGVLSVNLQDGFNSPLLKQLGIHGVPRIMLLDREGRIIESYAKRPSDPKLPYQLSTLILKN